MLGRLATEAPIIVEAGATLREIAASAPVNLRQLEGALTRVLAIASITSREPTPELVREALGQNPGGSESAGGGRRSGGEPPASRRSRTPWARPSG